MWEESRCPILIARLLCDQGGVFHFSSLKSSLGFELAAPGLGSETQDTRAARRFS
jgi:hypothetical protein